MPVLILLAFVFLAISWCPQGGSAAAPATFSFDMHHRFSDTVRRWMETHTPGGGWPERGTAAYYAALARHDRILSGIPPVTFIDGNATARISEFGFLHYVVVSLGTPSVQFLVALDTGSDLFWVPCDCSSCAPTSSASYGNEFEFNIYSPSMSMTSQGVPCSSSFCESRSRCSGGNSECQYRVSYVSAGTSTSGYLVEDVLHLTTEDSHPKVVEARVTFGCGKVQTGSFLDAAAPNGLLGLGMEKTSVPSILSREGLTSDSFSMCFGSDGIGRISFGDKGSSDQAETPFIVKQLHPTYNISITGISVGNISIDVNFSALIDSGTSFTSLADPAYTKLMENLDAKVQDKRYNSDSHIPFEYCYRRSSIEMTLVPSLHLTTKGGSQFPVTDPIIPFSIKQHEYVYCFSVLRSSNLNIIGQNFMTGLRVVFDRERKILGWKKFNCYDTEDTALLSVNKPNSSIPAHEPDRYRSEATKGSGNNSQITVLTPPVKSLSSQLSSFTIVTMMFLLPLAIS